MIESFLLIPQSFAKWKQKYRKTSTRTSISISEDITDRQLVKIIIIHAHKLEESSTTIWDIKFECRNTHEWYVCGLALI